MAAQHRPPAHRVLAPRAPTMPGIDGDRDGLRRFLYERYPFRSLAEVDKILDARDVFPDGETYMALLEDLAAQGAVDLMVHVPALLDAFGVCGQFEAAARSDSEVTAHLATHQPPKET